MKNMDQIMKQRLLLNLPKLKLLKVMTRNQEPPRKEVENQNPKPKFNLPLLKIRNKLLLLMELLLLKRKKMALKKK